MVKKDFFDFQLCEKYLIDVVAHYEKSAPTVSRYADDVYIRLQEGEPVLVRELLKLVELQLEGEWLPPNAAANLIYHHEERLGRDVTGQAGF